MAAPSPRELLAFLQEHAFLTRPQLQQLAEGLKSADTSALARSLVDRNWLSAYQVNQLLQGRGRELVVGAYRLLEPLGEGGMGKVFRARQVRMERIVALKMIPPEHLANSNALSRFYREVRAIAQLSHPNIVTAYEANQDGDTFYLAMEFVDGIDLARLVGQSGPLPIPQACEFIRQAALGLQHAHEKGLVHRDIKPGNLMVTRSSVAGRPVVKILDFGLARFEDQAAHGTRLTQLGKVLGTVDYISPEQAGDARVVDIRADIYSLGCSLFYLLTGKPPFEGADSMERTLARLVKDAPLLRGLRAEVPAALEGVVARMLARRPEDRYRTPAEVAGALEPFTRRVLPDEQVRSSPTPSVEAQNPDKIWESLEEPATSTVSAGRSRHNSLLATVSLVILLGLVFGSWAIWKTSGRMRLPSQQTNSRQTKSAEAVKLLPLIEPTQDTVQAQLAGNWTFDMDRALVSPVGMPGTSWPRLLQIPYIPPQEYDLNLTVEKTQGDGCLLLGMIWGGRQIGCLFDAAPEHGPFSGFCADDMSLINLDLKAERNRRLARKGLILSQARPAGITVAVRKSAVSVMVDGKQLASASLKEDFDRLFVEEPWRIPNKAVLYLGAHTPAVYRIGKMELKPVSEEGKVFTRPDYVILDIRKACSCASTRLFDGGQLVFSRWGDQVHCAVPFHVLDPQGGQTKNTICLFSSAGDISRAMPRVAQVPCRRTVKSIHLLGGVAGWGFVPGVKQTISMTVALVYSDGTREEHPLVNGVHISDWATGPDVPGSKRVRIQPTGNVHVRYLAIKPQHQDREIDRIEFIKGDDVTSPLVMAVTLEKAN